MIELEVIDSPDKDILGHYLNFSNKLIVGKSQDCDFIISDPSLLGPQLTLEIFAPQLRAIPHEGTLFWLNGKKSVGQKNLKMGDILKIGETSLKILSFVSGPWTAPAEKSIEEKVKSISESDPLRAKILQALREELLFLDQEEEYVSKDSP